MTTTQQPPPVRTRRGRKVVLVLLLLAGVIGTVAYFFREELQDEWALRQFRRAAASDDPALPQRQEQLLKRLTRKQENENLDRAVRLADDPDPKVRAASVEMLLTDQPKAKKRDAVEGLHANVRFASWRSRVSAAVERLLKDPDETVRKKALQAVSELEWADLFRTPLTDAMKTGTPAERLIVANSLANWNGALLREVIADPNQSDEVRIAAMRSLDTWGDHDVAVWRGELRETLATALKSGNAELRRAAIPALRFAQRAPDVWLDVLCDEKQKDLHTLALQTWIDSLGNGSAMIWSDSHEAWFHSTSKAVRCGVATYALCEGAKRQMQLLERDPPVGEIAALHDRQGPTGRAFEMQLSRLGNVLSVASAVRWYCDVIEKPPELVVWLHYEPPNGAPPKRDIKALLFQQVKPIWGWCLAHKTGYETRFLTANSIVRSYSNRAEAGPVPVRSLGAVLNDLLLDQTEFDKLRARYDGK